MEELRGLLGVGVLPEILRRIFLAGRSGNLHLAYGVEKSDLSFSEGYLIRAGTSAPGAHLGDLLVQIGFISDRDRDACLEIASLANKRFGETLVRHGLIDLDHLAQGLALQFREVLVRSLVWAGGVYTFTDLLELKAPTPDPFARPRVDPREVLLDATWTLVSDPAIDGLLGDLTQRVRRPKDARLRDLDFRLSPADAFLLSRVDEGLTAEQLLQLSPAPPDEAKASLAGLLAVGAIEYVGAPPPTAMTSEVSRFELAHVAAMCGSSDPHELLGVSNNVSPEELRSAYLKLLRLCDPSATTDAELRPILGRMSEQMTGAFIEIERRRGAPPRESVPASIERRAPTQRRRPPPVFTRRVSPAPVPETPVISPSMAASPPPQRGPAEPAPSPTITTPARPLDPSQAVEASAQAFEAGRLHEALAILHEAIPHLIGRERRAARVRKARILLAVEHGAKLAEDELRAAILEDPGNGPAHAELGRIYQDRGSVALAMMEYGKALELEPRNAAAREGLQQLKPQDPEPGPSGSIFQRLFRR